ncbi:FAD-dependent oxidoreductase, partial [Oleiphilus sp. HI0123]
MNTSPIVVIGSGLAGYNLVKEVRKLDQESEIIVITQDDAHSYSKPMLSTALAKGKQADELSMADPGKFAAQHNISIRNHTSVDRIDTSAKAILIGEERLDYSKLVLACGAQVNKLSFPGSELEKVVSINDLMDYRRFRSLLGENCSESQNHVLIMGAGLIGCEYANDLLASGYKVTIVDPSKSALNSLIPEEAGQALIEGLSDAGCQFEMQAHVSEITEQGNGLLARLSNGQELECALVISAVGLKANIQIAQDSGIECQQGIVTNALLQTSAEDVYALGDCAEIEGQVRLYVLPLMTCARTLAKTLTGTPSQVSFGIMPIATKTPACPVVVCPPASASGQWRFEQDGLNICGRHYNEQDCLDGFVLTG